MTLITTISIPLNGDDVEFTVSIDPLGDWCLVRPDCSDDIERTRSLPQDVKDRIAFAVKWEIEPPTKADRYAA